MKVFLAAVLLFLFLGDIQASVISDPNIALSEQQQNELSDLLTILLAVYDNDFTQIPSEPNEILALETSEDSRDQLAWEIIRMIQCIPDLNSTLCDENSLMVIDEQNVSAIISENNPNPNTDSLNSETTDMNSQTGLSIQEQAIGFAQSMESIEELSNPLGSCILQSKTYRITTLPLEIEGHVVIPAGTKLIAPYDPNAVIVEVMPGGLLDMGKAVNNSDPNYPNILPLVEIVPEDPNGCFNRNLIGIYIDRGANPNTRIENVVITGCTVGLVVDEQMTYPVRNVITFGCYDGIHLYAPGQIVDSEFWFNGAVYDELYDYAGSGVYVYLDSVQYPCPEVRIDRTVIYDGDVGIYIEGRIPDPNFADPNQAVPSVKLMNSCFVLGYYYGIYKTGADVSIDIEYCAFGGNDYDVNFNTPFTGCIGLAYDPFYVVGNEKKLYIDPWSEMIDAGCGMAEDGMGTCPDWPDIGQLDIGCHFPIGVQGSFGIPSSPADFNWDGIVDEWDLEIMDWCMGATGDPNIVRFDTSFDSRINMPDFGLMSFDYGYSNDANLPGSHDPNCERSDFNGDHQVDLEDVGILAGHWLTKVFDDYRLCGLCNIGINDPNDPSNPYDPNDPNSPDTSNIIDSRDYDAFMANWGKQSYSGCSFTFDNDAGQTIEPNALCGEVTVLPEGFPSSTLSIFAQIDGRPARKSYPGFDESASIDIPTDEYGNGWHTLTVGGYTLDGGCWMENTKVQFQNSLYLVSVPDKYEPNQPLYFSAFNNGSDDVSVNVYADCGNLVWSQTYNGNNISYSIPAEITSQHEIDYINFDKSDGTSITKVADPAESESSPADPNVKALVILPDKKIRLYDYRTISQVQNAFKNRGIKYKKLAGQSATYFNVAKYAKKGHIKYLYVAAHGSYVGSEDVTVLRTGLGLWDGWVVSILYSDFLPGHAPSWCEKFPDNLEYTMRSFNAMGFNSLEFAYLDTCYSGRLKINDQGFLVEGQSGQYGLFDGPHSDMSLALGMNDTSKSRVCQGWYDENPSRLQVWPFETIYQLFSRNLWESLGEGNNLEESIWDAINQQEDFGPSDPVNNYRLKGQGIPTDIRLRSN